MPKRYPCQSGICKSHSMTTIALSPSSKREPPSPAPLQFVSLLRIHAHFLGEFLRFQFSNAGSSHAFSCYIREPSSSWYFFQQRYCHGHQASSWLLGLDPPPSQKANTLSTFNFLTKRSPPFHSLWSVSWILTNISGFSWLAEAQ